MMRDEMVSYRVSALYVSNGGCGEEMGITVFNMSCVTPTSHFVNRERKMSWNFRTTATSNG